MLFTRVPSKLLLALICLFAVAFVWFFHFRSPRAWAVAEVPVAFWAWRAQTPTEAEVQRAGRETRARTVFLRAGQLDYDRGALRRIRAVTGAFPREIELHLVYNGTRSLLAEFERLDSEALVIAIIQALSEDSARASSEGARVAGLQLDFDVPTRLLPRYRQILQAIRARLPQSIKLSITGLPTWMGSSAISDALAQVDFWIPQFYGVAIPDRLDQLTPISSPQAIRRSIVRARQLNRPFYAGLSAYGYAVLYSASGALIELRGDLDPALVARHPDFELVERHPFEASAKSSEANQAPIASEWRYVYRARGDGVIDGLTVRADDRLMLDVPSAGALRACARAVREEAGATLLGLCVFRLPGAGDATTLRLGEIAAALADTASVIAADVRLTRAADEQSRDSHLLLTAINTGTASALMGDGALTIELRVPAGSVRGVASLDHFTSFETLCDLPGDALSHGARELRPCSARRASVVRLKARDWMAGAKAQAVLSVASLPPPTLSALLTVSADDGRVWRDQRAIAVE